LFLQEDKLPYAFYIADEELAVQLGAYMQQKNGDRPKMHPELFWFCFHLILVVWWNLMYNLM
jgi:hypothetical protein